MHIQTVIAGNQIKDVSTLACGPVSPQPSLRTREQQLQAIARSSHDIAHQVFVLAAFARRPDIQHQKRKLIIQG